MRLSYVGRGAFRRCLLWGTLLFGSCLAAACLTSVEGERASSGDCPEGEVCSDATVDGLKFWGQAFYDESMLQLGPVLAGGQFEVGIQTPGGEPPPEFDYAVEDPSVLGAWRGTGTFGPTNDDGTPIYDIENYLQLEGTSPGKTYLRILDPDTGALYDRIELEVFQLEDVKVINVTEPEREHLYAGCEEMVGVRLLADNGTVEVRGFDQDVEIRAETGTVGEEPRFWDCILYEVPKGRSEVTFHVEAADQSFDRTMAVRTLEEDGLTECPEIMPD